MKTFLITGGAGFLGNHLAHRLLKDGYRVLILDIAPLADTELLGKVEFHQGDVRDFPLMERLTQMADVVIHCAASLPLASNKEILSTNIEGTRIALETAHAAQVKRFINISSTAVYGVSEKHPNLESDPLVEAGAYGKSKIEGEKLCEDYRKKGLIVTIVRPKTFIGIGRLGIFAILFEWIKDGKRIPVIGNGSNRYQLLSVDDLVDFIVLASQADPEVANNTYNVGAQEFDTVQEDFEKLFAVAKTGARLRKTSAPLVKFFLRIFEVMGLSPLYKWVYGTADKDSYVSIEKARHAFDWHPKKSNAEALIETYTWYLTHWQEYEHRQGITSHEPWKQGVLKAVKWLS